MGQKMEFGLTGWCHAPHDHGEFPLGMPHEQRPSYRELHEEKLGLRVQTTAYFHTSSDDEGMSSWSAWKDDRLRAFAFSLLHGQLACYSSGLLITIFSHS